MIGEKGSDAPKEFRYGKGGRPKKEVKRDQLICIKCSFSERTLIKIKSKAAGVSISEYVRESVLKTGKLDYKVKVIPKEVFAFTSTLNHMAANLNQLAKKNNREAPLTAGEKEQLLAISFEVKGLSEQMKNLLR